MRLIATMACRNEDWTLGLSLRAALMWNDAVFLLLHECTDRTKEIMFEIGKEHKGRVIFKEASGSWDEMRHRQTMLDAARFQRATHISIVDCDEILSGDLLGSIRLHIQSMAPGRILQLPGYNLRGGLDRYHANGIWGDRWFSVAFPDNKRLNWSGDCFHQREPGGAVMPWSRPVAQGQGGVMHLWGASERRLIAKHALYKMTETLHWAGKSRAEINSLYNLAFRPSENRQFEQSWRYSEVPAAWWEPYGNLRSLVNLDATPWQEEMCRQLLAEHGAERFAGLDLFGVCEPAAVTR